MTIKNQIQSHAHIDPSEFEKRHDAIADRVFDFVTHDLEIIYQAYNDKIEDNLDEVPIEGKLQISEGQYTSEILDSPTWLELSDIANEQVKQTEDYNHRYLKDIRVLEEKNGIKICQFLLQS